MAVEDLQKQSPLDKDSRERLDTGQTDGNQGLYEKLIRNLFYFESYKMICVI